MILFVWSAWISSCFTAKGSTYVGKPIHQTITPSNHRISLQLSSFHGQLSVVGLQRPVVCSHFCAVTGQQSAAGTHDKPLSIPGWGIQIFGNSPVTKNVNWNEVFALHCTGIPINLELRMTCDFKESGGVQHTRKPNNHPITKSPNTICIQQSAISNHPSAIIPQQSHPPHIIIDYTLRLLRELNSIP